MKKYILVIIGRTAYWVGWPVLYFYLRGTTRTRVAIIAEGKILVARGWLGDGCWELPGGGVHKGEEILLGAVREVAEETGISLTTGQLYSLGSFEAENNKIKFISKAFYVKLPVQPLIRPQKNEIAELKWVTEDELNQGNTEPASINAIASLAQKNLL